MPGFSNQTRQFVRNTPLMVWRVGRQAAAQAQQPPPGEAEELDNGMQKGGLRNVPISIRVAPGPLLPPDGGGKTREDEFAASSSERKRTLSSYHAEVQGISLE
ncbi:hypothetical protein AVEN_23962-1 [Araneus ventricosus]|uniref:Uncharacterized protein n=1 Tax=Araneus ventricosus TaxID=182803 RepID=A0A4Y2Q0J4_ARAVE|nr:hypothetical protein AVEN_23962-1 [Araneus ventricosus]